MKIAVSFPIDNFNDFRTKMLNWAYQFNIFCFLDNQHYDFSAPAFECLLAAGCKRKIEAPAGKALAQLQNFYSREKGEWIFGHLAYDLKNETEDLLSHKKDDIGFSDLHFFVPEIVLQLDADTVKIYCDKGAGDIYDAIRSFPVSTSPEKTNAKVQRKIEREKYISIIEKLKQHILRGDCYEINFCQEFFSNNCVIDPLNVYNHLASVSPNPFSVLYKTGNAYCLCASPERYLKRSGKMICSQPIKGTSRRDTKNTEADETAKQYLLNSAKEKSENVMVVDLVRNDLSRVCKPGSVKVEELFGIYSFPHVHQMISTISGELRDDMNWVDCIRATFPMGSMTGAPKKRVMELIEQYEETKRGLFSGAIGYVNPEGDFDFNVVIRSMFYNMAEKYLSFQTGSAITYYSDAEKEYDECTLKAEAMMSVLG